MIRKSLTVRRNSITSSRPVGFSKPKPSTVMWLPEIDRWDLHESWYVPAARLFQHHGLFGCRLNMQLDFHVHPVALFKQHDIARLDDTERFLHITAV